MSKKIMILFITIFTIAMVFAACSSTTPPAAPSEPAPSATPADNSVAADPFASYDNYKWDYILCAALTHMRTENFQAFCDAVDERTNGHLKITLLGLGEHPYTTSEFISVVSQGMAEMGDPSGSSGLAELPSIAVTTLPFLIANNADYAKAAQAAKGIILEELETRWNCIGLTISAETGQVLAGQGEPLTNLASMAGRKYRGQNSFGMEYLEAVGGFAVNVSFGELASALSTGVINAFNTGTNSISSTALYEMCDWVSRYPMNYSCASMIINKDAWNSLPEEFQTIMREEAANFEASTWAALDKWDADAYDVIEKAGTPVLDYDPAFMQEAYEFAKNKGLYDRWTTQSGEWLIKSYEAVVNALY